MLQGFLKVLERMKVLKMVKVKLKVMVVYVNHYNLQYNKKLHNR